MKNSYEQANIMKNSCCEVFPKLVKNFKWFSYIDNGKKIYLMPCLSDDIFYSDKLRVNYCPSCGANISDITIDENLFMKYINS